jgi:hypothetical protein
MMQIFLLLSIVVVLIFIAVKLRRIEESQQNLYKSRLTQTLSSSLNPLFSEQEIAFQRDIAAKWQSKLEYYFHLLQRHGKNEIKDHHASGKAKTEFKPSAWLKSILLEEAAALVGKNISEIRTRQMIEANISIINGKSIAEVSEQYDRQKGKIPWEDLGLTASAWQSEPDIEKMYDEKLEQRTAYWLEHWDDILKEDDLPLT